MVNTTTGSLVKIKSLPDAHTTTNIRKVSSDQNKNNHQNSGERMRVMSLAGEAHMYMSFSRCSRSCILVGCEEESNN